MWLFQEKAAWKNPFYTRKEELANSITHGIGAALSVAGLITLVVLAIVYGDIWRIVSFSIYGSSLLTLYLASTLYHSLQRPRVKAVLRKFDHASIYILIAGTYTPFLLVSLRGTAVGWTFFILVWGMAVAGIAWKMFFLGRLEVIATIIYVLMGWMCVLVFKQMMAAIPTAGLVMLVTGGVVYTLGVIFYAWEKLPYNHAIWHLFVLGGSICHFVAIITLLQPH
ncbi:MAG: hemolysin III family protein [Anaerolineales bacterium]|nr:hemolysin III family protein [Anaerolineales bacterium]